MPVSSIQRKHHVQLHGNLAAERDLILVHGFGSDQTCWTKVLPAFAEHYRILTFDNVGAGRSDPDAFVQHQYLGLQGYANDLIELCQAYEVRKACVVGHSAGGMVAALATLKAPQHFERLVLLSASPRYLNDTGYVGGFTHDDLQRTYSAVMGNYPAWVRGFAPQAMNSPEQPELAQHFADTLQQIKPKNALTVLCAILQSDHRADVARIHLPTLILHCRDDLFVPPEVAMYLYAHIAGSRLEAINAKGHFPHLSAPAEVIGALQRFLAG